MHEINELRGVVSVEVGGGLVGQYQRRPMHDGAGDGDALALAAGEQVGAMVGARREAHAFEGRGHALSAFAASHSLDEERILDVLRGCEYWDQIEGLEDEADPVAAQGGRSHRAERRRLHAVDENAATRGPVDTANQVEKRSFSTATGAGDGEKLACFDADAGVFERADQVLFSVMIEWKFAADGVNSDDWVHVSTPFCAASFFSQDRGGRLEARGIPDEGLKKPMNGIKVGMNRRRVVGYWKEVEARYGF